MQIYILGVTHDQQTDPSPEFEAYIKEIFSSHDIRSLGEEMSLDGLSDVGESKTILKCFADRMHIPHKYCGITREERAQRGILGLQDIDIQKFQYDWSQSKVEQETQRYFNMIEDAWIEKLSSAFVDPMLFVCGADHLDSFADKATKHGFTAIILERKFITSKEDFKKKWMKKN